METPLQLELHGVKSTRYLKELVDGHVAKIRKRFGRATGCRVVVRAPNAHQRSGAPYRVTVRIALPAGREVMVGNTPGDKARLTGLKAALNDAFKRALRQLEDKTELMQGRNRRRGVRSPA